MKFFFLLLFLSISFGVCNLQATSLLNIEKEMKRLVRHGAILLNDDRGNTILALNAEKRLMVASLFKIVTVLATLEILGENFRFQTIFYTNRKKDLRIYGTGDPFLISEEIDQICKNIKKLGVREIRNLILDTSAFPKRLKIPGVSKSKRNYDAINGPLIVNFNTIYIKRDPQGNVLSAEKHTPLTLLAKRKGNYIRKGTSRRINISSNEKESLQYTGELFQALLKANGIRMTGAFKITRKQKDEHWKQFYIHYNSKGLSEMLKALLRYSNNYIANQIYLTLGARVYDYPVETTKSQKAFQNYLKKKFKMTQKDVLFDEGSGISRKTQMTGNAMMRVLGQFRPYAHWLWRSHGILAKTGTLTGVYNYAGYFENGSKLYPFIIMMNQKNNYRDQVLSLLNKYLRQHLRQKKDF